MKKLSRKQIVIINIVTIVVAILVVILFRVFRKPGEGKMKVIESRHEFSLVKNENQNQFDLLLDGDILPDTSFPEDYMLLDTMKTDYLSSCVLMLSSNGELYLVNEEGECELVSEHVKTFSIAPYGTSIAYLLESDELVFYMIDTMERKTVSEHVSDAFSLSPDGTALLFTMEDHENIKCAVYFSDGRMQVLGDRYYPIAVSNEGKEAYVYAPDSDALISCKDGKERVLMTAYSDLFYPVMMETEDRVNFVDRVVLNMDGSELIFSTGTGAYLSRNGGKPEKIADTEVIVPEKEHTNSVVSDTAVGTAIFYPYASIWK